MQQNNKYSLCHDIQLTNQEVLDLHKAPQMHLVVKQNQVPWQCFVHLYEPAAPPNGSANQCKTPCSNQPVSFLLSMPIFGVKGSR